MEIKCDKIEMNYWLEEIRAKHKGAYLPWTVEYDNELTVLFYEGVKVKALAEHFGRTMGAIRSRISKLELERSTPPAPQNL